MLYQGKVEARSKNIIDLCDHDFYGPVPGPDPGPIRVTRKDDSFVIVLDGDVLFDFDKSDLKPASGPVLDRAAQTVKSVWRNGSIVPVNGYTDGVGSDDYNNGLSERRAQAVAHALVKRGLPISVMRPRGFGKANPVASNNDSAGRAKNRRVEIYVLRP